MEYWKSNFWITAVAVVVIAFIIKNSFALALTVLLVESLLFLIIYGIVFLFYKSGEGLNKANWQKFIYFSFGSVAAVFLSMWFLSWNNK